MDDGAYTAGVQHHYMHGLRFDGMWGYQTRSRTGRKSWARLDLGSDAYPWAQEDDLEGAGWCVRCCASVLGQRPVSLAHMQKSPVPAGEPANVASALREILPTFDIGVQLGTGQELVHKVANTFGAGGGVLARLQRQHVLRPIPMCWVWIVGVETKPMPLNEKGNPALTLLLVSRELGPPWCSGYGAKASWMNDSMTIRSVDGQVWEGVFNAILGVLPR